MTLDIPIIDGHYAVSSVCKWESDDLVKIYWCDGVHQIRVLNVATTHPNLNVDSLNISPKSQLPPLFFKGLGTGGLKAGKYQYCYQLFNPRTSETSISVLSPIITVSRSLEILTAKISMVVLKKKLLIGPLNYRLLLILTLLVELE